MAVSQVGLFDGAAGQEDVIPYTCGSGIRNGECHGDQFGGKNGELLMAMRATSLKNLRSKM